MGAPTLPLQLRSDFGARRDPELYSESLPSPSGWFCIGAASEIAAGTVATRHLCGREIVVFRTADGGFAALDAHCPHLGAHMGEGGRVEGDTIRCPFHGFCFDSNGACTKTQYGSKPPRARARSYPVIVLHGVVLAYFHPRGLAPSWRPEGTDMEGWPPFRLHRWTLRGHPQETTENSVDVGHFGVVHGYRNVHERAPTKIVGPHLVARYGFEGRPTRFFGRTLTVHETIEVHAWGLGYSRVHVADLSCGVDLRLLVLATPIDADHIELRLGLSLRDFAVSPRVPAALRWLPRAMTDGLIAPALLRIYRSEVEQDCAIWAHKRYVDRPVLALGDGPVALYRRWARQFYDDPASAG